MLSSRGRVSRNDAQLRVESSVRGSLTDWAPRKLPGNRLTNGSLTRSLIPCRRITCRRISCQQRGSIGRNKRATQQPMTCVTRLPARFAQPDATFCAPFGAATLALLECARCFQRSDGSCRARATLADWNDSNAGERTFVLWPCSRTMRRCGSLKTYLFYRDRLRKNGNSYLLVSSS